MILSTPIILALILGLALLAHSSAPRGVLTLAALGVVAYFLMPVVGVFSTLGTSGHTPHETGDSSSLNPVEWFYAVPRLLYRFLERSFSLDALEILAILIGIYVILQLTLLVVWRGGWRVAAAVPLALVAFVVWAMTQDAGNLGPIPLLIILPATAGYLIVLVLLRLVWRVVLGLGYSAGRPTRTDPSVPSL